uniref:Fer-1-like protein 6 n=1 Tax=Acanthochromis polyacanthus TaxID=80966 RepID=A0A3Q1FBX6_9TELE
ILFVSSSASSKGKMMFGLKVKKKKKKKVNSDLVLANRGAVGSMMDLNLKVHLLNIDLNGVNTDAVTYFIDRKSFPVVFHSLFALQVAINITEARQLVGENIDPSVVIEIGDEKKQTTVKEGTNAPFYNEYFVFDFFAHKEVFFDKVIKLTVMHSKMLRSFCVGSFKLDVWTVYKQPGHQFINKWAMLTNPGDISTGVKGYVKCDISVSAKGDAMQPGQKTSDAEEQIDKNLLIPDGFPAERPWARFCVKVYRAEGLPRNNSSIMANVTKAFIGDNTALIDPYVVVGFFRQTRSGTNRSSSPRCFLLYVWDEGSMSDVAIGTHYFDLRRISNEQDGDRGFLPTFGPAWINLYGSARNFSLGDDTVELNEGIGEGVSYRGRVYLELAVEILSGGTGSESKLSRTMKPLKEVKAGKTGGKEVKTGGGAAAGGGGAGGGGEEDKGKAAGAELLPVEPPPALDDDNKESFLLFGVLFEATMIDRKIGDRPISFEFSLGNYGNVLESVAPPIHPSPAVSRRRKDLDFLDTSSPSSQTSPLLPRDPQDASSKTSRSTTTPEKPLIVEGNRYFMYLPLEKQKPCVHVVSHWEDRSYRLYNSNMLDNIARLFEEGVSSAAELHRKSDPSSESLLRSVLSEFCLDARSFIAAAEVKLKAELKSNYLTQLDKKRLTMCKQELESMIGEAQSTVQKKRKAGGVKEMLQEATKLTQKLRFLVEEVRRTPEHWLVWFIHLQPHHNLVLPASAHATTRHILKSKIHMLDNLPAGLSPTTGGTDASSPPTHLKQHQFQLRCHMYQARGLIAADNTGLSDPFARVTFQSHSQTTNIISQTLSPTWNQCLPMSRLLLSGDLQNIQEEPPRVLVEVYDDDALGKAEYLGSTVVVPEVQLTSDPYSPPTLHYSPLHCGSQPGGDLLAAFELLQSGLQSLPELEEEDGGLFTVPPNIRPVLSTYRLEVLFWGLRELKKVQFLSVDRPQVFIECAGKTLRSSVIQKYKSNPNFTTLVDELPENEHLHPPLSITVVDWRAFGRSTLVGNHIINNLKAFKYTPPPAPPAAPQTYKAATLTPGAAFITDPHSTDGNDETPPPVPPTRKRELSKTKTTRGRSTKRRRRTIADESAESVIDWWLVLETSNGVAKVIVSMQLYDKELETEFGPFDDWVNTYELFRGKATEEDGATEERFVGKFKGRFCLYKLTEDEDDDWDEDSGHFRVNRGIPANCSVQVLIRVYIVSASNLHPADPDGKADPYIVLRLGKNEIKDRDNYIPKQLNPVFGRSFEMQATFPRESLLSVLIYDFDLVGGDDLIGETRIDLENRFYSRHRATCGLPTEYSLEGYNAWRDCLKPSELLSKMCRENGLDGPHFRPGRITVADKVFTGKTLFMHEGRDRNTETLLWIQLFWRPSVDISPRKPKGYELRIIIWNTEDVILEDSNFLTGQKSSDIYCLYCLFVSLFMVVLCLFVVILFVFPVLCLFAVVLCLFVSLCICFLSLSGDCVPLQLCEVCVCLFACVCSGTLELNLHGFHRGAKTAKSCKADMLTDGSEKISIFQQKRARGWWPFSKSGELTGKVEAEFHLVTVEEAEKNPVGRARKEPEPLPKPKYGEPETECRFVSFCGCFLSLLCGSVSLWSFCIFLLIFCICVNFFLSVMFGCVL